MIVLLTHKSPGSVIKIKAEFEEGNDKISLDAIAKILAETENFIQDDTKYVEKKYGFKGHTAYRLYCRGKEETGTDNV